MDYVTHYRSPLGDITLAADDDALFGLWFEGQRFYADALSPDSAERPDHPVFRDTRRWLDVYFGGRNPDFTPPIRPRGTAFRLRVWNILLSIPWGATATYGDIARRLSESGRSAASPRAVGGAVAHNPLSLIIPCHRVLGASGRLTGYAGGLDRKAALLGLEQSPHLSR